eukprot:112976_1
MAIDIFEEVYSLVVFFSTLWIVGKISERLGVPSVVGEIITGIVVGPHFLDLVPNHSALMAIGDIGLLLLILEAGLDVNMGVLKVVGSRGLKIALFGSVIPMLMGSGIAYAVQPTINIRTALAIGACFAPTSLAIALNVLRNAKVLNTPTGQLIIAAGVLDDVIGLMLLSVLTEFSKDEISYVDLTIAVMGSPILMLIFGAIALHVSPRVIKYVMNRIDIKYHEHAILFMLFTSMLILVPVCHLARSSYLLGAFLAGLLFCTDHTIHHVWEKQMQKIMHWLLRIFFACTIGFEVPIKDFLDPNVVLSGLIYFTAIFGKIATGFFALIKPIKATEFFTIGCSMSAWGEFGFILATAAYNAGIFGHDTLSQILLAVLLSVILSPLLLKIVLQVARKKQGRLIKYTRKNTGSGVSRTGNILGVSPSRGHAKSPSRGWRNYLNMSMNNEDSLDGNTLHSCTASTYTHFVYYRIQTKTFGKWGHQDRLLRCLYSQLKLNLIDFRVFNELHDDYSPFIEDVFFVKDTQLQLLPTNQLEAADEAKLLKRVHFIRRCIKDALQDKRAKINIMRWLPGIRKDEDSGTLLDEEGAISDPKRILPVAYVRTEAYKQARFALSTRQLRPWLADSHPTERARNNDNPNKAGILKRNRLNHWSHSELDMSSQRNIHSDMYDDLVKLNLAGVSTFELNTSDDGSNEEDNSIRLDVLYADHDVNIFNSQPSSSGNSITTNTANHNTPLLKKTTI